MKIMMLVLLILLAAISGATAQQEISPELVEQIEGLEAYVARTRQLDMLTPVDRRFPARAEAIEQVKTMIAEEIPPEEGERLNHFYIAFDFLPAGTDYITLYTSLIEVQVAGFYDTVTKEMNTLLLDSDQPGDELPLLEQTIYVHEFVHALQDQHFALDSLLESGEYSPDQSLAISALVEGDATLIMNEYVEMLAERNPFGTAMQLLVQGFNANALFMPPDLPDILARELLSAYTDGAAFVGVLHAQAGWEGVNAAYEPGNLPESSEQILHPDKYLAEESPLSVQLNAPALESDWETVWDTTFGEFYLREYLRTQLPTQQAARAAAGWGGDHYQIYHNTATGELAWIMRIEWDSAVDADEFASAYTEFLAARFEDVVAQDSCWSDAGETLCLVDDEGAHLLVFAPTLVMAQDLITSQGR